MVSGFFDGGRKDFFGAASVPDRVPAVRPNGRFWSVRGPNTGPFGMLILGLVGSPGGGKSTVAATLEGIGATWIDADRIARDVLREPAVRDALADRFGPEILADDGSIDRPRLGRVVFGADHFRRASLDYLESLVHPPTRREISARLRRAASQGRAVAVLDVPLLFESRWDLACDQVWCVDAPLRIRISRVASRGWDAAELRRRERHQLTIDEKRRRSNRRIHNVGTFEQLTEQVSKLYRELTDRCSRVAPDPGHCLSD